MTAFVGYLRTIPQSLPWNSPDNSKFIPTPYSSWRNPVSSLASPFATPCGPLWKKLSNPTPKTSHTWPTSSSWEIFTHPLPKKLEMCRCSRFLFCPSGSLFRFFRRKQAPINWVPIKCKDSVISWMNSLKSLFWIKLKRKAPAHTSPLGWK